MSDPVQPSDAYDRRYLHRPTAWWAEFMRPLERVAAAPVSVHLSQGPEEDVGWIDLALKLGDVETVEFFRRQ